MHPRGTSSRVPMHSRVTIFSTSLTTTNPRRELKPMHQMQCQEHTKCSSPSLSNPTKATKAMEEYERKNKDKHQEIQDLDPQGSPHKEASCVGGLVPGQGHPGERNLSRQGWPRLGCSWAELGRRTADCLRAISRTEC